MLIAIVMPRSLNEPVGFAPSTLRYTSHPVRAESTGAGSSGVPPSWRVITGSPAVTGSRSRYSVMTPRHGARAPEIAGDAFRASEGETLITALPPLPPA